MERLCTQAIAGEIAPKDQAVLEAHLAVCRECRAFLRDLDEMTLFGLTAVAARRLEVEPIPEFEADEEMLFTRILKQAESAERSGPEPPRVVPITDGNDAGSWYGRWLRSLRPVTAYAGWIAACLLLLWMNPRLHMHPQAEPQAMPLAARVPAPKTEASVDDAWKARALADEYFVKQLQQSVEQSKSALQASYASQQMQSEVQRKLSDELFSAKGQLAQVQDKLHQQFVALSFAQTSLDTTRGSAAALQAQLNEVNQRDEKQRAEIAHFREVAATVPVRISTRNADFDGDARELFGARDLHIVDVYDIDKAGNTSRAYGRVYYVNHHLLLFYAFDLNRGKMQHQAVAFQAWGYRQPNSTNAESLGLFCLDDPKIGRWALRVSDPKILSHIDTLFVTVEPPGGSKAPKGHRLLLASLGEPPNHP